MDLLEDGPEQFSLFVATSFVPSLGTLDKFSSRY